MKHDMRITLFLVLIFVVAQIAGLFLINYDAKVVKTENGTTVTHADTAVGPRPQTSGYGTIAFLIVGVLIGTLLVLIVIRFKKMFLWKAWFFIAVTIAITISLGVFMFWALALILALGIAAWKLWKSNVFIHNISEILVYAGIALLIVPMFKAVQGENFWMSPVFLAVLLLLIISIYDAYAVWRSKHMVKMAQFQSQSKVFAGLMIPYTSKKGSDAVKIETKASKIQAAKVSAAKSDTIPIGATDDSHKTAILGGGDIAFPLIFSGVVMENLMVQGLSKMAAFGYTMIITLFTTIALFWLLYKSKKDTFYPAMPFISAGCLIGYLVLVLLL